MTTMSIVPGEHSGNTTASVTAPNLAASNNTRPEFIRVPKNGTCPFSGLSRSKIYDLITPNEGNDYRPPVKSVSLRKRGQLKGTRLVVYQSLLDYLYSEVEHFQHSLGKEVQK